MTNLSNQGLLINLYFQYCFPNRHFSAKIYSNPAEQSHIYYIFWAKRFPKRSKVNNNLTYERSIYNLQLD